MKELASISVFAGHWESDDPALKNIRAWPIRGFKNHLIFYRLRKDGLEVVRVLHAAQDIERALHGS